MPAPTQFAASAMSASEVVATWIDNASDEDGFELEASVDGTVFELASTSGPDETIGFWLGQSSGGTRWFRARAFRGNVFSAYTPPFGVTMPVTAPNAPSGLTAFIPGGENVVLDWYDDSDSEASFVIEESADGGQNWTTVQSVTADVTTCTLPLTQGRTTHLFRVFAQNASGNSPTTNEATPTTTRASHVLFAFYGAGHGFGNNWLRQTARDIDEKAILSSSTRMSNALRYLKRRLDTMAPFGEITDAEVDAQPMIRVLGYSHGAINAFNFCSAIRQATNDLIDGVSLSKRIQVQLLHTIDPIKIGNGLTQGADIPNVVDHIDWTQDTPGPKAIDVWNGFTWEAMQFDSVLGMILKGNHIHGNNTGRKEWWMPAQWGLYQSHFLFPTRGGDQGENYWARMWGDAPYINHDTIVWFAY